MKDSLLTVKQKKEILVSVKRKRYTNIIVILEKVKTAHAGTAKTKDKRFVITELVKHVLDNDKIPGDEFFNIGFSLCKRNEPVAKEIGVAIIWRGYKQNPKVVKQVLLQIADDDNWEVREYAANAFANILYYNNDLYPSILKWTSHKSDRVRRAVVFSALAFCEKSTLAKAFAILKPLMFDDSKYVKKNLGPFILGTYFCNRFPKETISRLKSWSKIRDENVRWNIVMSFNNSFGNKYPELALEVLKNLAGDVDLSVNRALISTLKFLKKRHNRLVENFLKINKLNIYKTE